MQEPTLTAGYWTMLEDGDLYGGGPVLNEHGLTYCCGCEDVDTVLTRDGVEYHCGACGTEVEAG